jgi:phage terminase Nu1 subunit (DNA packaging protein)
MRQPRGDPRRHCQHPGAHGSQGTGENCDRHAHASKQRARLAAAQADLNELKAARLRGELVEASAVEQEWVNVLQVVRAGMLAVSSRVAARLSHLSRTDVGEIDAEVRAALTEIGEA